MQLQFGKISNVGYQPHFDRVNSVHEEANVKDSHFQDDEGTHYQAEGWVTAISTIDTPEGKKRFRLEGPFRPQLRVSADKQHDFLRVKLMPDSSSAAGYQGWTYGPAEENFIVDLRNLLTQDTFTSNKKDDEPPTIQQTEVIGQADEPTGAVLVKLAEDVRELYRQCQTIHQKAIEEFLAARNPAVANTASP